MIQHKNLNYPMFMLGIMTLTILVNVLKNTMDIYPVLLFINNNFLKVPIYFGYSVEQITKLSYTYCMIKQCNNGKEG